MNHPRPLDLFLVAGEVSGDHLGAKLMAELRRVSTDGVTFRGVGGTSMEAAGLQSLFPMADIAVMGFLPVLARLPRLLRRIRQTADAICARPPDALVIIDSPDFTHRVARRVRARLPDIPIIDYVSPTVWAWRPGRAPRMRHYVDHLLALLPFEPRVHSELGGPACTYTGHPLIERLAEFQSNADDNARRDAKPPVVLVLPGSRRSEISRLLEVFRQTLELVRRETGEMDIVLPAVEHLAREIGEHVKSWPQKPRIVIGEKAKLAAFRQARAALAASGTVTLELALAHVPAVVAYRVSKIEELIARRLIRTKWISMPNIILGETAYPEFIQDEARPDVLASHLCAIIAAGEARERQMSALQRVETALRLEAGDSPSGRAARIVMEVIAEKTAAARGRA